MTAGAAAGITLDPSYQIAVGLGPYASAVEAAEAMSDKDLREVQPSTQNMARYAELQEIYREIYPNLRGTFSKLARLRGTE